MDIDENRKKYKRATMAYKGLVITSGSFFVFTIPAGYLFGENYFPIMMICGIVSIMGTAMVSSIWGKIPRLKIGDVISSESSEKWEKEDTRYEVIDRGEKSYLVKHLATGELSNLYFYDQHKYIIENKNKAKQLPQSQDLALNKFINSKIKDVV